MNARRPVTRPCCGTNAGYQEHVDHQERTCPPCRKAHREHRAAYLSDPLAAAVHAWESRTRYRALRLLARKYPAQFMRLLEEVRAADPRPVAAEEASRAA